MKEINGTEGVTYEELSALIHARLKKAPSGCLEWQKINHNAPTFNLMRREFGIKKAINVRKFMLDEAGLIAYELNKRVIAKCGNPACCNPEHMIYGDDVLPLDEFERKQKEKLEKAMNILNAAWAGMLKRIDRQIKPIRGTTMNF